MWTVGSLIIYDLEKTKRRRSVHVQNEGIEGERFEQWPEDQQEVICL